MHQPTPDPPPHRPHQPPTAGTGRSTEPEPGPAAPDPAVAADPAPEPGGPEARDAADGGAAPAAPQPLGVALTPTGEPAVDTPLRRLADADHLAVGAHLAVYEDVHRGLRDALAALDGQPGPPAPTPAGHGPATNDLRS
ncbi:hypothetical protein [Streptomyces catenulae]|uniref:Uncharacterized protein n=1 Tax=Streptomyces catenulae TaxID=66875 RepID=A0ABV2Z2S0_9ACTN|nr:hypothetical protein [Streptomyces catenulae]